MCYDLSKFKEIFLVSGITVTLPNGLKLPIRHTGTIQLSDSLILYNVLHVPSFHFNLISVSTLLHDNQCSAHFYIIYCYLQEFSQGLMIRSSNLHQNLYILDTNSLSHPVKSHVVASFCGSLTSEGNLWHQRLGHPSHAKLQVLSSTFSISKSNLASHDHCQVCPLAK